MPLHTEVGCSDCEDATPVTTTTSNPDYASQRLGLGKPWQRRAFLAFAVQQQNPYYPYVPLDTTATVLSWILTMLSSATAGHASAFQIGPKCPHYKANQDMDIDLTVAKEVGAALPRFAIHISEEYADSKPLDTLIRTYGAYRIRVVVTTRSSSMSYLRALGWSRDRSISCAETA